MEEKEKCFAYTYTPLGWRCLALNVCQCEYPKCKTFKTKEDIIEQKKWCLKRIQSLSPEKKYDIFLKYGDYQVD